MSATHEAAEDRAVVLDLEGFPMAVLTAKQAEQSVARGEIEATPERARVYRLKSSAVEGSYKPLSGEQRRARQVAKRREDEQRQRVARRRAQRAPGRNSR